VQVKLRCNEFDRQIAKRIPDYLDDKIAPLENPRSCEKVDF